MIKPQSGSKKAEAYQEWLFIGEGPIVAESAVPAADLVSVDGGASEFVVVLCVSEEGQYSGGAAFCTVGCSCLAITSTFCWGGDSSSIVAILLVAWLSETITCNGIIRIGIPSTI